MSSDFRMHNIEGLSSLFELFCIQRAQIICLKNKIHDVSCHDIQDLIMKGINALSAIEDDLS